MKTTKEVRQKKKTGETQRELELRRVGLARGDYAGDVIMNCDMRGLVMDGLDWRDSQFHGCNMQGSSWKGALLDDCMFAQCELQGAGMRAIEVDAMIWSENHAQGMDFSGSTLRSCHFVRVSFEQARFAQACLPDSTFSECSLAKLDLTGARLERGLIY